MILFIGLWFIIIAVCTVVGVRILQAIRARAFDRIGDRFSVSVWLGVSAVSVLLLAVSLVFPLSPLNGAMTAGFLVLLSIIDRNTRNEIKSFGAVLSPRLLIGALALSLGVAAYTTQSVTWYDTGLYHFGAMKWLSDFGAVPGLALTHLRFGFASSWFALGAPFSTELLEGRTTALLGGLALSLTVFHFLLCASRCLTNRARLADWFLASASTLFIPVIVYWGACISPSPDVPVLSLTVVVAWTIIIILDAPRPEKRNGFFLGASIIPFILSVAATTMKLSALTLIIISTLFYLSQHRFNLRSLLSLSVVGLILIAPLLGYQIVTSGCPLFPMPLMCLDLPWAVRAEEARRLTDVITMWARWDGPTPPDANAFNWLWRRWITGGTTSKSILAMFFSSVVAAVGFIIIRIGRKRRIGLWLAVLGIAGLAFLMMTRANNLLIVCILLLALITYRQQFVGKSWLMAAGLLGAAMMLYGAPSIRFGFGYIAVLWACFAVTQRDAVRRALHPVSLSLQKRNLSAVVIPALLVAAGLGIGVCRVALAIRAPRRSPVAYTEGDGFPLTVPPRMSAAIVERKRINDFDFYKPVETDQCWATPLPCVPMTGPLEDVTLREPARGIAGGFKHGGRFVPQTPLSKSR